ncbi:MAG TPA: hypothetical protein VFS43_44180 [Polyangiaceae bacterium]|nr:hypothetical protein [Polyangiaceae bacterium]
MSFRPYAPSLAFFALAALAPGAAQAQGPVTKKAPMGVAEAQREFDDALRALEAGGEADCTTLCRALSSLARATERLCNLTRGEAEATERRCTDARARLKDATQRVRSACPECALAGQAPPTVGVKPGEEKPVEPAPREQTPPPMAPPPAPADMSFESAPSSAASAEEVVERHRGGVSVTAGVGLSRLALPPGLVKAYGEIAPIERASVLFSFGLGQLPVKSGGRAGVFSVEAQPRVYALGGAGRGGAFVGGALTIASALGSKAIGRENRTAIDAPLLAAGVSVGPVAGAKLVLRSGLTIDLHGGVGFVVGSRPPGERRVVPLGDLSLGWTF